MEPGDFARNDPETEANFLNQHLNLTKGLPGSVIDMFFLYVEFTFLGPKDYRRKRGFLEGLVCLFFDAGRESKNNTPGRRECEFKSSGWNQGVLVAWNQRLLTQLLCERPS